MALPFYPLKQLKRTLQSNTFLPIEVKMKVKLLLSLRNQILLNGEYLPMGGGGSFFLNTSRTVFFKLGNFKMSGLHFPKYPSQHTLKPAHLKVAKFEKHFSIASLRLPHHSYQVSKMLFRNKNSYPYPVVSKLFL